MSDQFPYGDHERVAVEDIGRTWTYFIFKDWMRCQTFGTVRIVAASIEEARQSLRRLSELGEICLKRQNDEGVSFK